MTTHIHYNYLFKILLKIPSLNIKEFNIKRWDFCTPYWVPLVLNRQESHGVKVKEVAAENLTLHTLRSHSMLLDTIFLCI